MQIFCRKVKDICKEEKLEEKSNKLEEVDLSDQHGLIAMTEAHNKVVDSSSVLPLEKNGIAPMKKTSKNVTCTKSTACFLFLIALISMILSSFITYWLTKEAYDRSIQIRPFIEEQSALVNSTMDEFMIEEDSTGPSAAELRLPKSIIPIWYNLTLKAYLPGYVEIPANKNLTFEAALIIKFRVDESTDRIVLNALKLNFPDDLEKIKILQDTVAQAKTDENFEMDQMTATESDMHNLAFTSKTENFDRPNETKKQQPISTKTIANVQVREIVINETLEMITMYLSGSLNANEQYYIQMPYTGPIDLKLAGLYLNRYQDNHERTRYAAVTQMEPTDARRMVPCFDEPEFKAVWRIKVIHPAGTFAVSNGIELKNAEKTDNPDWVVTSFMESPPMSSYLLAIAITDFAFIEGITKKGTRFRIWSREEAVNQTAYALRAGIAALEFYENYYNIPFPLKKQDMMALPDFAAGAMENWGLITYREQYLLYDERLYSPYQKASVALVVAHELAHQWFGNLVTMKWWNDLWLNEGFATFMQYLGADAISKGHFRMTDYFLQDAVQLAYRRDGQATSHPLSFPIDKAEDVSEAFDSITYDKGSAIIYMIQHVMGSEVFKKGLNDYLESYKYNNADHDDLWSALNKVVPESLLSWEGERLDIRDFASKWTQQMGYPIVEVYRIDDNKIDLRQKRFKWDADALERKKFRNAKFWYKYDIPIWYSLNGQEMPMTWLHESQELDVSRNDLLILNSGSKGFYRVNYNLELWQKIIDKLHTDPKQIDVRSRAQIINDAFSLAEGNFISYEIPLNLTKYLSMEEEFLPWRMALIGFSTIVSNFNDEPETQHVRDYLNSLISPMYNRIDWKTLETSYLDETMFFENELQYEIIGQMYHLRAINCTERLYGLFQKMLMDECQDQHAMSSECSKVPVPIRLQVYCEGVRVGAERVWNKMFDLYKNERVQVERNRLLRALTCSRDSFTLKTLLKLASNLNDSSIRLQDTPTVFASVGVGDVGRLIIFDYFQDNWAQIHNDMKDQQTLLRKVISSSTLISNERRISQLETFIKKYRKDTSKLDVFGQRLEEGRTAKVGLLNRFSF
ncbi:unnamed protein product [Thelazia callipaeda]|uniref:Aminopeptidase n=1 Tax=Thelazia callipaeda TaxID=103827 RepID=A0A0N5CYT5_THECL|nr:unnamed protein product [Thelazia callipaeda]